MKTIWITVLILTCSALIQKGNAQQEVTGKISIKSGPTIAGDFAINLTGPNDNYITITGTAIPSSRSRNTATPSKTPTTRTFSVDLIHHIVVNDTTYFLRDIKVGNDDKYEKNVAVTRIEGTLYCGIFQRARSAGNSNIAVKLPLKELSKLVSIDLEFLTPGSCDTNQGNANR